MAHDKWSKSTLTWGVRDSFVSYLMSLPDGEAVAAEGVEADAGGTSWRFQPDGWSPEEEGVTFRFRGDLRFRGHAGMMLVMLLDPWLSIGRDGAVLSTVDLMAWPDRSARMRLAVSPSFDLAALKSAGDTAEIPLTITPAGCEVFNNIYQAGERMAPVVLATRP